MTLIKICGISRPEDAALAIELGADFVGLVFVKESPRYVTPEGARELVQLMRARGAGRGAQELVRAQGAGRGGQELDRDDPLPPAPRPLRPATVGVFRDASARDINTIARTAGLDLVQLHGSEPDSIVRELELPVIRAVRVTDALPDTRTSAPWLLFDTGGGTGRSFDWSLLGSYERTTPFFLAGGLTPDNVAEAIRIARPDAIDLSSGVERAPGIKDHDKMKSLFARVRP